MIKESLIQSILQVNTVSHIINDDRLPKDRKRLISNEDLFIQLAFLDKSDLIKICNDLHITV
jgi:hypothetical protein